MRPQKKQAYFFENMLAASCSWFRIAGLPDLVRQEVHARDAAFTEEAAGVHENDVPIREDMLWISPMASKRFIACHHLFTLPLDSACPSPCGLWSSGP